MTDTQIVGEYSDASLVGIIRQLSSWDGWGWGGKWTERLNAAKAELRRREREDAESEDPKQYLENATV